MIHPVAFYALAAVVILCALLVVSVRNIFHAGLFLIGTFLGVAGLYVSLQNFFLAAVQLLVYSGAIAVLILFGIMMTQRYWSEKQPSHNRLGIVALPLCGGLFWLLIQAYSHLPQTQIVPVMENMIHGMGVVLMQVYVVPFEIISVVLLAAMIGAIAIGKEKEES